MKIGDLVRKLTDPENDLGAGLGLIIMVARDAAVHGHHPRYKVLWSNNYGTFWTPESNLEIVNEDW